MMIKNVLICIRKWCNNFSTNKLRKMKHKKKLERLEGLKRWWDNQSQSYQKANTKPGSVKAL